MICPVCGNNSPDSLSECQFCSTPLTPSAIKAPQYIPGTAQYGAASPQYGSQQPQYGAPQMQRSTSAQPQYGMNQQQYGTAPQQYAMTQQYVMNQPNYGTQQPQYSASQPQYGSTSSPYAPAQPAYGASSASGNAQSTAEEENTAEIAADENEEENAENEKKVSKGTMTALLVWFVFIAIAFAALYFDLPGMVSGLIGASTPSATVSDTDSTGGSENSADGQQTDEEPVMDALYGTWVLCTYYVQDLTDSAVTGGQHYTHAVPLQFYTFDCGRLDRFSGSTAATLSHDESEYTYTNGIYTGSLISGGSNAPAVVLDESYMCIYDTFEIDGVSCYVEYALLRVFDEPATDEAVTVYAEAIENGTVSLPQYSSSVMTNPSMATSAPTASTSQISATYGMLGTWLLTERSHTQYDSTGQPVGETAVSSFTSGTRTYNYVVFRLDNTYILYTISFSEDMTECIEKTSDTGTYEFNDGLMAAALASDRTSVTAGGGSMYLEYDVAGDGVTNHYRDTYISISSDEYGYDELTTLRPDVD